MKEFKLIIAGGRDFSDYSLLKRSVTKLLADKIPEFEIIIISSVVKGGDMLGEKYAGEFGYEVVEVPLYPFEGKEKELLCNKQMAAIADACICFWDGKSKGTKQIIEVATGLGLQLTVIAY